jgi:NTE family protein
MISVKGLSVFRCGVGWMINQYKNLALSGGGVWGISYAGAFEELERLGILQQICCVAGTSAGSMAGLLLALGYTSTEIIQKIRNADYAKILGHGNVNQIVTHYGYYNGNHATQVFRSWVEEKLGSADATFGDLISANGLDLRVYATNLNTRQVFEFSYKKTKAVSLADAVRASMSVPLFFTATEIDRQIYVDGGTLFDFPLTGYDKSEFDHTLGLAFAQSAVVATEDQKDKDFGFRQPLQYVKRLATVLQRVQSPVFALHEDLQHNTILIDTAGVSSLNFKLTQAEKERLIANGRQAVREHFHNKVSY